jgi:F0F1-type ATP synthase beta subunit
MTDQEVEMCFLQGYQDATAIVAALAIEALHEDRSYTAQRLGNVRNYLANAAVSIGHRYFRDRCPESDILGWA